jgi:hypothetical protein
MLEHVKMTLTDSDDGSICGENYDLTFHNEWENMVPDPVLGDTIMSDTHYANISFFRSNGQIGTITATWQFSSTVTETDSWSFTGGLTFGEATKLNLGATYNPSSSVAISVSGSSTISVPEGKSETPEVTVLWTRHHVLVDHYNSYGYDATYQGYYDDLNTVHENEGWLEQPYNN